MFVYSATESGADLHYNNPAAESCPNACMFTAALVELKKLLLAVEIHFRKCVKLPTKRDIEASLVEHS